VSSPNRSLTTPIGIAAGIAAAMLAASCDRTSVADSDTDRATDIRYDDRAAVPGADQPWPVLHPDQLAGRDPADSVQACIDHHLQTGRACVVTTGPDAGTTVDPVGDDSDPVFDTGATGSD
jgi:hypothetical protein